MTNRLAQCIKSHPSLQQIEKDGAIGLRSTFTLEDGSDLANFTRPLWVNTQPWEKVTFVAITWHGGTSGAPHLDGTHTTFRLFDTHGDVGLTRGVQHPEGAEWHFFNKHSDLQRSVVLAFAYLHTNQPPDALLPYIDGGGIIPSQLSTRTQGHLTNNNQSDYLSGSYGFAGNQEILSLGPKTVTTESCSHRFGDQYCGATIQRTVGMVTAVNTSSFVAQVEIEFSSALPLPVVRYLAGFICPISGNAQGNANDIVDITLLSGTKYRIKLGSLPRLPWQPYSFVVVGNGCRKTIAACNENGRLSNMWAMPFTPGTKSFMAGSELVKPTGPNIP